MYLQAPSTTPLLGNFTQVQGSIQNLKTEQCRDERVGKTFINVGFPSQSRYRQDVPIGTACIFFGILIIFSKNLLKALKHQQILALQKYEKTKNYRNMFAFILKTDLHAKSNRKDTPIYHN